MSSADQAFESHRLQEYRPTANQDFVFSRAQVRYCLAEEIRMEGARSAVNRYSDLDVERFNNMIADYNSRCGKFRYRSGVLEGARSDVEPYREELKAEGRSKFADKPFYNGSSNSTPTAPEPDVRLKRVQQPLEQPGNYGSVVDELDGPDTQPAIVDFQKGNALPETGKVDDDLVSPLDSTPVKPSNSWPNPAEELQSESPPLPSSTTSWVPANAVAWGSARSDSNRKAIAVFLQTCRPMLPLGVRAGYATWDLGVRETPASQRRRIKDSMLITPVFGKIPPALTSTTKEHEQDQPNRNCDMPIVECAERPFSKKPVTI